MHRNFGLTLKNRASREKNEVYFNFSEAQPVLSKSKTNLFDFAFPLKTLKPLKPLNFDCPLSSLKNKQERRSAFLLYPFNYYICNNN